MGNWFYILAISITVLMVISASIIVSDATKAIAFKIFYVLLAIGIILWWWIPLRHSNDDVERLRNKNSSKVACEKAHPGQRCLYIQGWYPISNTGTKPVRTVSFGGF